ALVFMILVSSSVGAAPVAALLGTDQPPVGGRRTRRAFRKEKTGEDAVFWWAGNGAWRQAKKLRRARCAIDRLPAARSPVNQGRDCAADGREARRIRPEPRGADRLQARRSLWVIMPMQKPAGELALPCLDQEQGDRAGGMNGKAADPGINTG